MCNLITGGIYNYGLTEDDATYYIVIHQNKDNIVTVDLNDYFQENMQTNSKINSEVSQFDDFVLDFMFYFLVDKTNFQKSIHGYIGQINDGSLRLFFEKVKELYPNWIK